MIDWIQSRDKTGLVVSFPSQNSELVHVAPELAGRILFGEVQGFDTRSREIHPGPKLIPNLFRRLPGWWWLAPLANVPAVSSVFYKYLRRP